MLEWMCDQNMRNIISILILLTFIVSTLGRDGKVCKLLNIINIVLSTNKNSQIFSINFQYCEVSTVEQPHRFHF